MTPVSLGQSRAGLRPRRLPPPLGPRCHLPRGRPPRDRPAAGTRRSRRRGAAGGQVRPAVPHVGAELLSAPVAVGGGPLWSPWVRYPAAQRDWWTRTSSRPGWLWRSRGTVRSGELHMPDHYFQGTPGAAAQRLRRQADPLSDCRASGQARHPERRCLFPPAVAGERSGMAEAVVGWSSQPSTRPRRRPPARASRDDLQAEGLGRTARLARRPASRRGSRARRHRPTRVMAATTVGVEGRCRPNPGPAPRRPSPRLGRSSPVSLDHRASCTNPVAASVRFLISRTPDPNRGEAPIRGGQRIPRRAERGAAGVHAA